jgi:hypothetical protein
MSISEFGPDGKRLGLDSETPYLLAVGEGSQWHLHPATARFHAGFLDEVEMDGMPVRCPKGMSGASITLYVCCRLREDQFGRTADIWEMRWDNGLLVESRHILSGAPVV